MRDLRFAYGGNGLSDHRLADACALLADHGYDGIALTLDHWHLDPFADDLDERIRTTRALLETHGLAVVVETGGRFVLDPRAKHQPNLVSDLGRRVRLDFYARAADIAVALGSPVLHLWSGVVPQGVAAEEAWDRLVTGVAETVSIAADAGLVLGFEPEPGMVVDTIEVFERLVADVDEAPELGLTLDIGHCRCLEPRSEADCVRRVADRLVHVQVEDMRRGVHEHLPFGHGEVDLVGALSALDEIEYTGLVSVELPRHGHAAHTLVPDSMTALRAARSAGRTEDSP